MQRHMASTVSDAHYSSHFTDDDSQVLDDNSTLAQLHRRLHPERQALTTEELKALIQHDQLESGTRERTEEDIGSDKTEPMLSDTSSPETITEKSTKYTRDPNDGVESVDT